MVDEFIKIFEGLDRAYGQFKRNESRVSAKVEGLSVVKREEVTRAMWENHLNGLEPSL